MADGFEERDRAYREFRKTNPDVSFAEFHAGLVVARIARGEALAQLGPRLTKHLDWREAGRVQFETYRDRFAIAGSAKITDYGCGTLRIGAHFIDYLEPDSYFGLDVTADLLAIGQEMLGADLLREKRPRFGVIGDAAAVAQAAAFGADFVYSSSVCTHVHPDEAATYFGNLEKLTGKPGAVLFFDMIIAGRPVPHRNLAWPLERYIAALEPLDFVALHISTEHEEEGQRITSGTLEFRRGVP